MQKVKATQIILAEQAKILDHERPGQDRRKVVQKHGCRRFGVGQSVAQCQVKAEFLHDMRIAPQFQQGALPGCQLCRMATRRLCLGQGRTQRIRPLDHRSAKFQQRRLAAKWCQRQKAVQVLQLQAFADHGGMPGCQHLDRLCCRFRRKALRQPERRSERAVKAVATGLCGEDRWKRKAGQVRLGQGSPRLCIPAQPPCSPGREFTGAWRVIDGVPFHLFHGRTPSGPLSHGCDGEMSGSPANGTTARQDQRP